MNRRGLLSFAVVAPVAAVLPAQKAFAAGELLSYGAPLKLSANIKRFQSGLISAGELRALEGLPAIERLCAETPIEVSVFGGEPSVLQKTIETTDRYIRPVLKMDGRGRIELDVETFNDLSEDGYLSGHA
jgi:hypothetical protein